MPYYLWIGELNEKLATTASPECRRSREMAIVKKVGEKYHRRKDSFYDVANDPKKKIHSNHHVKMMAALTALYSSNITGLYYFDMDAVVKVKFFGDVQKYASLIRSDKENNVDVLFGTMTSKLFWQVHGSSFYVRNVQPARQLIAAWFGARCGFKDQFSLWHVILTFAVRSGCDLTYHGEIFSQLTYSEARRIGAGHEQNFLPNLKPMDCDARAQSCPDFRFCLPNRSRPLHDDLFIHKSIPTDVSHTFFVHHDTSKEAAPSWNFTVQGSALDTPSSDHLFSELGLLLDNKKSSSPLFGRACTIL